MSNNFKMLIQIVHVCTTGTVLTVVVWVLTPPIVCTLTQVCRRNIQPPSSGSVSWFLNFPVWYYLRDPTVAMYRHMPAYKIEPYNDCDDYRCYMDSVHLIVQTKAECSPGTTVSNYNIART